MKPIFSSLLLSFLLVSCGNNSGGWDPEKEISNQNARARECDKVKSSPTHAYKNIINSVEYFQVRGNTVWNRYAGSCNGPYKLGKYWQKGGKTRMFKLDNRGNLILYVKEFDSDRVSKQVIPKLK